MMGIRKKEQMICSFFSAQLCWAQQAKALAQAQQVPKKDLQQAKAFAQAQQVPKKDLPRPGISESIS
ncbi:hypothetical protein ACXFAU_12935 [Paenibacillus glucanolyticus]